MDKKIYNAKTIIPGKAHGIVLKSEEAFMFAHGVEPSTGRLTDRRSSVYGENMKDKVFVMPSNKGSTTGSAWILETLRCKNGPAAVLISNCDFIVATGFVLGKILYDQKIPVVEITDEIFQAIKPGDQIRLEVDGEKAVIEIE